MHPQEMARGWQYDQEYLDRVLPKYDDGYLVFKITREYLDGLPKSAVVLDQRRRVVYSRETYAVAPPDMALTNHHLCAFFLATNAYEFYGLGNKIWIAHGRGLVNPMPLRYPVEGGYLKTHVETYENWPHSTVMFREIRLIREVSARRLNGMAAEEDREARRHWKAYKYDEDYPHCRALFRMAEEARDGKNVLW